METYYTGNENILKKNLKTYKKDMEPYKKNKRLSSQITAFIFNRY